MSRSGDNFRYFLFQAEHHQIGARTWHGFEMTSVFPVQLNLSLEILEVISDSSICKTG
jgi:hypothetical protein